MGIMGSVRTQDEQKLRVCMEALAKVVFPPNKLPTTVIVCKLQMKV